jgi:hypothetical protein
MGPGEDAGDNARGTTRVHSVRFWHPLRFLSLGYENTVEQY